jgi:hypothetical protein
MLVIKNYIIDSDKIHAQIQENKKKSLRNKVNSNVNFKNGTSWGSKAKDKRNSNFSFIKKKFRFGSFFFVLVNHDFDIYCTFNTVQLRGTYYHVILKSRRRLSVLYENDLD